MWVFYRDIYPSDPGKRQALDLCVLCDLSFNRFDPAAREMLSTPANAGRRNGAMIRVPAPQLSAADYPEFRRTCLGLPPTHPEWVFNQRQYHQNREASDHELVPIAIGPDELKKYCRREGCQPTTDALYGLAADKFKKMLAQ